MRARRRARRGTRGRRERTSWSGGVGGGGSDAMGERCGRRGCGRARTRTRARARPPGRGAPEETFRQASSKMISPLDGLWGRLIPMSLMFYFMAFANSIMDAVKDTLVVTAFGGAEQIPYLTVYAVLPTSLLFVSLFAKLSSKFGREKLFYFAVTFFMAFLPYSRACCIRFETFCIRTSWRRTSPPFFRTVSREASPSSPTGRTLFLRRR